MALPSRFQMFDTVTVCSELPKRDFTGPVVGIHFAADGIVRYDVRDSGSNIVRMIDQLYVFPIDHKRPPPRATRAQRIEI